MHVRRGAARLTAVLLLSAGALLAGPAALAQDADPCPPQPVEPAPDEPVSSTPGAIGDDGIVCAFGVPVSAPVDSAAGGGVTAAPGAAAPEAAPQPAANGAVAAGQLPRTGFRERLAALAAAGVALLALGAGALVLARRHEASLP